MLSSKSLCFAYSQVSSAAGSKPSFVTERPAAIYVGLERLFVIAWATMYCKAGVACTNPEVYGDIKRGRRLAPSKGIVCPRCQGKCCNEACLEKHKCKQRARPSNSVAGGMRAVHQRAWQGLDPNMVFDPTLLDPSMAMALARAGQGGLLLPQGTHNNSTSCMMPVASEWLVYAHSSRASRYSCLILACIGVHASWWYEALDVAVTAAITLRYVPVSSCSAHLEACKGFGYAEMPHCTTSTH